MPIEAKLNIKGMEAELERIVRLGRDIDVSADRALDKGSDVLVVGMQRRAPRRTGRLVNSIKKFWKNDGNFHRVVVQPDLGENRSNLYPVYVEVGTKKHGKAQPYAKPTREQDAGIARKALKESLKKDGMI